MQTESCAESKKYRFSERIIKYAMQKLQKLNKRFVIAYWAVGNKDTYPDVSVDTGIGSATFRGYQLMHMPTRVSDALAHAATYDDVIVS